MTTGVSLRARAIPHSRHAMTPHSGEIITVWVDIPHRSFNISIPGQDHIDIPIPDDQFPLVIVFNGGSSVNITLEQPSILPPLLQQRLDFIAAAAAPTRNPREFSFSPKHWPKALYALSRKCPSARPIFEHPIMQVQLPLDITSPKHRNPTC